MSMELSDGWIYSTVNISTPFLSNLEFLGPMPNPPRPCVNFKPRLSPLYWSWLLLQDFMLCDSNWRSGTWGHLQSTPALMYHFGNSFHSIRFSEQKKRGVLASWPVWPITPWIIHFITGSNCLDNLINKVVSHPLHCNLHWPTCCDQAVCIVAIRLKSGECGLNPSVMKLMSLSKT